MRRTQISLGKGELELLDAVARETGASRSELVRRAVRSTFGQAAKADKLRALSAGAGSWRGRALTGSDVSWVPVGEEVGRAAGELARGYRRAYGGNDDADYFIAASALLREADLLTTNVRHFPMLPRLAAPY